MAATRASNYHACECYGHDNTLPDYPHEVSVPRTLQGYYAKKGGCPCPAKSDGAAAPGAGCVCGRAADPARPTNTYRAAGGPHSVYPESGAASGFPNAKNYGGTVSQRGATTLENTARPYGAEAKQRASEKKSERMQDRKNFLKAVLRDEMLARMDAEAKRDALEQDTGLMGGRHFVEYEAGLKASGNSATFDATGSGPSASRGRGHLPSVGAQYEEVIDELRYVAGEPVGSKLNINRLYYLLEEEDRINRLRREEKLAARTKMM